MHTHRSPSPCPSRLSALLAVLVPALLVHAPAALAQEGRSQEDTYVAIELLLGVGGEADVGFDVAGFSGSGDADLDPSFGGALSWMHPLHRHFVLGLEFGALSWEVENAPDRNLLIDVLAVPQGRLPINDELELTLSLPLGLVVDFWGGDDFQALGAMVDVAPAVGFELGVLLGLRYAVSTDVGLLARLGYVMHSFTHEIEGSVGGATATFDADISLGQPRIQLGVSF